MENANWGNKLVSKVITILKNREYNLDINITKLELLEICFEKFAMVIRGFFIRPFLGKATGLIFIGKNVRIQFKKKIKVGKNIIIHNGCHINALSKKGITIGDNFTLGENSIIECTGIISELGEELVIGDNVGISAKAVISTRGTIRIGSGTIMGPYVSIHSENHGFVKTNTPIRLQNTSRKGIIIGENCWIGAKATILDNTFIGKESIIAAGAVVTKNVPEFAIVAGVPAKIIKYRR